MGTTGNLWKPTVGTDPLLVGCMQPTNGINTEANVKTAINDIVKNNPFLDDIDLAGVTDSTHQLTYTLAKKQSALRLILLLISKVTAFDASTLKAGYQHASP